MSSRIRVHRGSLAPLAPLLCSVAPLLCSVALLAGVGGCADSDPPADASAPALSCAELEQAYAKAVEQARACDPTGDDQQCTEVVDSKIACGCPVLVSPANAAAIGQLEQTQQAFADQGCPPAGTCPAIGCVEPGQGVCLVKTGNLQSGVCADDASR